MVWDRNNRVVVGSAVGQKFADLVRIVPGKRLEIDGEEFPWCITEEGPTVSGLSRSELTTITVSILCERVVIDEEERKGE